MNLSRLAALGLVVALAGACDTDKKPEAQGATNNTTASTNSKTAEQTADKTTPSDLPIEATGPVAKVDGEEITAAEFNEEVGRLKEMMGGRMPPGMLVNMKGQIVEQLVAKKLVEKAVKEHGIKVTDEEVNAEYAKFEKQLEEAAPGGAKEYLKKLGRTEAEMKVDVRRSLELKALMAKSHDIDVPEAEVKKYFTENKAEFDQPERVKASHILLKLEKDAPKEKVTEVETKAKELAGKAKAAGADFGALAREHSEGPTGPRGGDLGYFVKGQMVPEFDEVAWKMKPGDISDPVRTQFGFHIIKVDDRKDAKSLTFEEAKDMITAKLQEPKLKTAMKATIDTLKEKAKVEKMEGNIKSNAAPPQQPPGMGGMGGHPPMTTPPGQGGGQGGQKAPKLQLDKLK